MAVLLIGMAHNSNSNAKNTTTDDVKPTIFHDFLGKGCDSDSSPVVAKSTTTGDPRLLHTEASASHGAVSGGGRGPISATSDLGSERQVGNHFEGVPFYGRRSDFSGPEISNRFAGSKRNNSDFSFMGSSRDGVPQMRPDSQESLHLMKILRDVRGERPRRLHDEETLFGLHPMRPTSASLILQPPSGGRTDAKSSKWERVIPTNIGPTVQCPPRAGQVASFGYQAMSNRLKDPNAGPSIISQAAADEGSRTGIKGSGILSSVNVSPGVSDRIPTGVLLSAGKQKFGTHISEPESSTHPSRHELTSGSHQMTIFYGGQAHVFDDVHPNKANVIMTLAGSNGGSWSTTYAPKAAARLSSGENMPSGENETGMASNFVLPREYRGRLSITGTSSQGLGSGDRISMPTGVHQGSIIIKDSRAPPQAAAEPGAEEKREV